MVNRSELSMRYSVLSLDGGGVRGIISVVLLERLAREPSIAGWLDRVRLLAGTSTGGLIALGIAAGISLSDLHRLYREDGPRIFEDTLADDILDLGKLIGADYSTEPRKQVLSRIFGAQTLGDLRRRVLITAFDLDNADPSPQSRHWKPKLFHNYPGRDSDASQPAYKVALYTSAAPTYFPTVDGYVDGGVFAPNPSMCALAQTQDLRTGESVPLQDVRLLSIGTGEVLQRIEGVALDWGYTQWARPIVDLMLNGTMGIADYQCRQMLRERYHRLAPVLPVDEAYALDDVAKIPAMIAFANRIDLTSTIAWIRTNVTMTDKD